MFDAKNMIALLTQDMEDILLHPPCSEEECQQKKLMSNCLMFKTRILLTLLNGFLTTLNLLFVISHQKVLRWQLHSSVTLLPSKRCSRESVNNSLLCSEERLSSTGILVKVWMRWSSLKLSQT